MKITIIFKATEIPNSHKFYALKQASGPLRESFFSVHNYNKSMGNNKKGSTSAQQFRTWILEPNCMDES